MSKPKYTFDELCESQDFDHDEEFVLAYKLDAVDEVVAKLEIKLAVANELLEFCLERIEDDEAYEKLTEYFKQAR